MAAGVVALAAADPDSASEVRVVVAGDQAAQPAELIALVQQLFGDEEIVLSVEQREQLDVREVIEPPATPDHLAARAWVVLDSQSTSAVVFVADGPWERVLVRRLEFDELGAVAREEIGFVLDSSVRAILDGGEIGVSRAIVAESLREPVEVPAADVVDASAGVEAAPGPETDAPPPAEQAPASSVHWIVDAGYRIRWAGSGVVQHGPLVAVGPQYRVGRLGIGGSVVGRAMLPARAERGNLGLDRWGGFVGARADAMLLIRPWLGIGLEATLGAEIVRTKPVALDARADAFDPSTEGFASGSLGLGPQFLGTGRGRFRVGIRAVMEFDATVVRYIAGDTGDLVFAPWPVRPGAQLTIGWEFS